MLFILPELVARIRKMGAVKIYAQNCLQAPAEWNQPAIEALSKMTLGCKQREKTEWSPAMDLCKDWQGSRTYAAPYTLEGALRKNKELILEIWKSQVLQVCFFGHLKIRCWRPTPISSVSFRQLLLHQAIRLRDLLVCILAAINNYSKSAGFLQLMSVKISAICIRTWKKCLHDS